MKKTVLLASLLLSLPVRLMADGGRLITLDLSKSTTPLAFNAETGAWNDTYNDDCESIESQCFSFVHSSMGDYNTWWGFTASNSADNVRQENTLKYQFSDMAKGGIVLNEDGTVKTDSYGAPVTSAEVPYLVAFYSPYMSKRPVDMTFNTGKSYKAVGVYVNLNSYSYYSIEYGDSFARAFTNGDRFTLTIHGVAPDETEKAVEVELAAYSNGNLTINRGWRYVDLSELGTVNELYFTMKSTDSGAYGDNTPEYFCLDKLIVEETGESAVSSAVADSGKISYLRSEKRVECPGSEFAAVYDVAGQMVMTSGDSSFSVRHLPAGVYIVRSGNRSLKFTK